MIIEHDKEWYEVVKNTINDNQKLLYCADSTEYENSITTKDDNFDVIIIDGIRRTLCSKVIEGYLNGESKEGFMVILDNSDWYKATSKYLRETLNLIEIDFHGFGPINKGLSGFRNAESHHLYNELLRGGPVRMPRLDENGPCIARRRRGVVSEQARLQAGHTCG